MIVDSSALVAIVLREPGHHELVTKLVRSAAGVGTPTLAKTGVVLANKLRQDPRDTLVRMLVEFDIAEIPFGEPHWKEAIDAYLRYGRGRHRARLNFGDCLTYAVARLANESLLFVGDDFAATDIEAA